MTDVVEVGTVEPGTDLNDRQRQFCREYIVDFNGTQAAIRAGHSKRSAAAIASENLKKPKIQAYLSVLIDERAKRTGITADRVIEELAVVGLSSIDHYRMNDRGRIELADDAPPEAVRAISSVKHKRRKLKNGTVIADAEYRLWDKPAALRTLAQHFGLLTERIEVEHSGGVMLVPGMIEDPDAWAKQARKQQALLPGANAT